MKKIIALSLTATLLSGCGLLDDIPVGKGFSAKYLCSYVFNSGFDEDQVTNRYIKDKVKPLPWIWTVNVDHEQQEVRVGDVFTDNTSVAFYTKGKGCTLLIDRTREDVEAIPFTASEPPEIRPEADGATNKEWPYGSATKSYQHSAINMAELRSAADTIFNESAYEGYDSRLNTTSVVIVHQGKLIYERYGQGADKHTPLLGWSMTKTITGMLIGKMADKGMLALDEPAPLPEWRDTERESITTRQLLNMAGGVLVNEDYTGFSDVTQMLYLESDQHRYAVSQPKVYEAGDHFEYSTAEANRLAAVIQNVLGSQQAVYDFYQQELFYPLNIRHGFIEFDAYGQMVGGAYGFMTARDWARLGLLYQQKGMWNGQQVLSREWVDFALAPSEAADNYGAQLWINTDGDRWEGLPDLRYFAGHQGQRVVLIPSHDLIIVRTGVTEDQSLQNKAISDLIKGVMAATQPTDP